MIGRVLLCLAFILFASKAAFAEEKLTVYTVNYPLSYFAERIGGDHVKVVFPVPAGEDPAFWQPDAKQVGAFQKADIILLNGAQYAKWVQNVSLPQSKLVDTSKSFRDEYIREVESGTHTHGPQGKHVHGKVAFTTWLDLKLALKQSHAIEEAFRKKKPAASVVFKKNLKTLTEELAALDKKLMEMSKRSAGMTLFGSHPVYQYLARGYDLDIISVHWEPDEVPSEGQFAELSALQKESDGRIMLWEGEPKEETVKKLKELGVESVVYNPAGNKPESDEFLAVLETNVSALSQSFELEHTRTRLETKQ